MDHPMLKELCEALGWQGGTIWQVLAEVKRIRLELNDAKARLAKIRHEVTSKANVSVSYIFRCINESPIENVH